MSPKGAEWLEPASWPWLQRSMVRIQSLPDIFLFTPHLRQTEYLSRLSSSPGITTQTINCLLTFDHFLCKREKDYSKLLRSVGVTYTCKHAIISKFDRITRNVIWQYLSHIGDQRIGEKVKLSNNRIYDDKWSGRLLFFNWSKQRFKRLVPFCLTCIKSEDKILWCSQYSLFLRILQKSDVFGFFRHY